MRKIFKKGKHRDHLLKKSRRPKRRSFNYEKGKNTKQARAYRQLRLKYAESLSLWDKQRIEFYKEYYSPINFSGDIKHLTVNQRVGVEEDIEYYSQIGEALIEGSPSSVQIDIQKCERVWPSSVMMFCSFLHWTKLRASDQSGPPRVSSTISNFNDVSSYLDFCGFHDYVRRAKTGTPHTYNDESVVKIQRESDGAAFDSRFDEISDFIRRNSSFDADQIEAFQAFILGEIMINVTEHGINYKEKGWYTLTQLHPTSQFISLNIADNGIGIKNSLKTGPQKVDLGSKGDHHYIRKAFKEDVSGAFSASTKKKGIIFKEYEKGQRRGNGLMHIKDACRDLGIQFTILSGKGYLQFDCTGKLVKQNSFSSTIFAGTLYSLQIPIKEGVC